MSHGQSAEPFHPRRELGVSGKLQSNEAPAWSCSSEMSPLLNVFCSVAQNRHHPGDRRFPGEEAGRRGRPLHRPAHARLPGWSFETTQTRLEELLRGSGCVLTSFTVSLCSEKPSPLSSSWTRDWPACWASTPRPDRSSSRLCGSTSRPINSRTLTSESLSTVTNTCNR